MADVGASSLRLPPRALLVVRHVSAGVGSRHAGAARSAGLRQAVLDELRDCARRANRPWTDADAWSAAAVIFADETELVACLVRDWLSGRVAERWWWKAVLGGLSPPQWLRQHVLARGELLAPAISVLAAGPEAAAWLARLEDGEAEEALRAIARSHSLPSAAMARGSARPRNSHEARASARALGRLVEVVPEARARALRPPQRRLTALALALARAPAWARTLQLASALQALDRAHPESETDSAGIREAAQEAVVRSPNPVPQANTPPPRDVSTRRGAPKRSPQRAGAAWRRDANDAPGAVPGGTKAASAAAREAPRSAQSGAVRGGEGRESAGRRETPPAQRSLPRAAPPSVEQARRVSTGFGGIFYLLNAALAMGLYSDFTAPRGKNLRCSPWNWLALVGREWFGRELVRDPLWGVLAGLAGRKRRALRRPRWLEPQLEGLRARLALALGEDPCADVAALVCRHRAGLAVTAARVDVHLALSELPLALRVAGLDRDPGWIPAAGRSIAFHFE